VERVTAIYRVLKPHLATLYERHLAVANPVYEPPTRRILDRLITEERRHAASGAIVLERLLAGDRARAARAEAWERRLLEALTAAAGVTGDAEAPLIAPPAVAPDPAAVAADLVPPPAAFDPAAALGDLAAPLEAHRHALAAGDLETVRRVLVPGTGPEVAASGRGARVVLQERWVPSEGGWRIATVEVTRAEPVR
jgi:hypothetical protein